MVENPKQNLMKLTAGKRYTINLFVLELFDWWFLQFSHKVQLCWHLLGNKSQRPTDDCRRDRLLCGFRVSVHPNDSQRCRQTPILPKVFVLFRAVEQTQICTGRCRRWKLYSTNICPSLGKEKMAHSAAPEAYTGIGKITVTLPLDTYGTKSVRVTQTWLQASAVCCVTEPWCSPSSASSTRIFLWGSEISF